MRHTLDNGLTVLIERDTTAPVVAVVTHVKAGYFDEPDEWVGVAHVLEHMFFKGTPGRPSGTLARETQRLGGYLNAGTIYDKTVYYTILPGDASAVARAIDLQADAIVNLVVDPAELAGELEVIVQEAKRKRDTPSAVAAETLFEVLFAQHRIRRWRIGTEEGLRALTAADLEAYYRTRYVPERTVLSIVGALDPEEVLSLVQDRYGHWRPGTGPVDGSPAETSPPGPAVQVLRGDVNRAIGLLGWRTVGPLHPSVHALDAAASVLSAGRGGWLGRMVRRTGLAATVSSHHYTPFDVGVFTVGVEGDPAKLRDALTRSSALVRLLRDRGPADQDMDRVRALTRVAWSRRLENMEARASLWAECEALGHWELAIEMFRNAMAVTTDEIRDATNEFLLPDMAGGVAYLPDSAGDVLVESEWPLGPEHVSVPGVDLPDRSRTPAARLPQSHDAGACARHVAMDGVDLIVRPKRGSGIVCLGLFAEGARHREREETSGLSSLVTRVATRGAGGIDAERLSYLAETLGGVVTPSILYGHAGWTMTVPVDRARDGAEVLMMVAADAGLDDEEVRVERDLQATDAERARDDMYRYPVRRVLAEAYPYASYGLPLHGDPDRIRGVTPVELVGWYRQMREGRLMAVAVGDLEADELIDAFQPAAAWAGRRSTPGIAAPAWCAGSHVERRDKQQTAIAMAFPGPSWGSSARPACTVLASLLSGMAGRLFEELRERRALAYTVNASTWHRPDVGAVITYIATSPDREREARDAMLTCLQQVADTPVSDDELERARNYAAGTQQLRWQSSHALLGEYLEAWTFGDVSAIETEASRLQAVTKDEVRDLAAQVFAADRAECVIRGE